MKDSVFNEGEYWDGRNVGCIVLCLCYRLVRRRDKFTAKLVSDYQNNHITVSYLPYARQMHVEIRAVIDVPFFAEDGFIAHFVDQVSKLFSDDVQILAGGAY